MGGDHPPLRQKGHALSRPRCSGPALCSAWTTSMLLRWLVLAVAVLNAITAHVTAHTLSLSRTNLHVPPPSYPIHQIREQSGPRWAAPGHPGMAQEDQSAERCKAHPLPAHALHGSERRAHVNMGDESQVVITQTFRGTQNCKNGVSTYSSTLTNTGGRECVQGKGDVCVRVCVCVCGRGILAILCIMSP